MCRWFPRSLLFGRRARRPALPLRSRRGYAADLHHDLPGPTHSPSRQFPAPGRRLADGSRHGYAPHSSPHPPGSSWSTIKRLYDTGSSACTFPSRSPGTARPVVPDRPDFVAAAPTHPRRSPRAGCRQLHPAATTAKRSRSLTSIRNNSASWRTMCSSTPIDRDAVEPVRVVDQHPLAFGQDGVVGGVPGDRRARRRPGPP